MIANAVRLTAGPGDPAAILAAIPWDRRTIQALLLTRLAEEPDTITATVSGEDLRDLKSTRLNSSHVSESRMPSSA